MKLKTILFEDINNEIISYTKFDLKKEYDRLNRELFNGELPNIPLKWKALTRVGGRVNATFSRAYGLKQDSLQLFLSTAYDRTYQQWLDLLAHEMIHIKIISDGNYKENHGWLFKSWMNRINAKGYHVTVMENASEEFTVSDNVHIKEVGAIVCKRENDKYSICLFKPSILQSILDELKSDDVIKRFQYSYSSVDVVLTNDKRLVSYPIMRELGIYRFWKIEKNLYDDLLKNSKKVEKIF